MSTIWKYPIPAQSMFFIDMPKGAKVLSVQVQHGIACMWVLVDPDQSLISTSFHVFGTGHKITSDPGDFVGTFQIDGGSLVFHLFKAESSYAKC